MFNDLTPEKKQARQNLINIMDKYGFWAYLGDNKIKCAVEFYHLIYDERGSLDIFERHQLRASLASVITSDGCPLRRPVAEGGLLEVEQWDDIVTICTARRFDAESYGITELAERVYWYGKQHGWHYDQRANKPYSWPKLLFSWSMFKEWLRCFLQPFAIAIVCICNKRFGGFVGTPHLCLIYLLDCFKSGTSGRLILISVAKCFKSQKWNVWAWPVLPFIWFWNKYHTWKNKRTDWGVVTFDRYYGCSPLKDLVTLAQNIKI